MFSDFEILLELDYDETATTIEDKYPQLKNGGAQMADFNLQGNIWTFYCKYNLVAQRLYYGVDDDNGEANISYASVREYPFNLATTQALKDVEIYFKDNKFFIKK